jgi:hypothetical protein
MEIVIVICLLIVIALLAKDKIIIKRVMKKQQRPPLANPGLPDIMGQPKPLRSLLRPKKDTRRQLIKPEEEPGSFELETGENGYTVEIPQEELEEVFGEEPDFDEEEVEWRRFGEPNGEEGFATGVTFEELSTVGALLQQEVLEPALEEQAVDIVHRIQGTELFSLLENSIENVSQKIARLLDKSISNKMDSSSSTMRNNDLEGFDIGEFV